MMRPRIGKRTFHHCGLGLLAAGSLAAMEVLPHPLQGQIEGAAVFDQDRLRAGLLACRPGSLWDDPAFATQRAHIIGQLQVWQRSEPEMPPLVEWVAGLRRHYVAIGIPTEALADDDDIRFAYLMDTGSATAATRTWFDKEFGDGHFEDVSVNGVAGRGEEGEAVFAWQGPVMLLSGHTLAKSLLPLRGELPGLPASAEVGRSQVDLRNLIILLEKLAQTDDEGRGVAELIFGKDWKGLAPRAEVRTEVDAVGGWRSRAVIEGAGSLPLHGIDPLLTARIPDGAPVVLAVASELEGLTQRVVKGFALQMGEDEAGGEQARGQIDAMLHGMLGIDLQGLLASARGDVALALCWEGITPVPQGVLVLGVTDAARLSGPVQRALATVNAQPTTIAGAQAAWTFGLPMDQRPIVVAITGDALIAGNDAEYVKQAVAGGQRRIALAAGTTIHLDLDVGVIAERWLPDALAELGTKHEVLGRDPLQCFQFASWSARQGLNEAKPASVSALLLNDEAGMGSWVKREFGKLYGEQNLEVSLDAKVAIWRNGDTGEVVFAIRRAAGVTVMMENDWSPPATPAEAEANLSQVGYSAVLGKPLAELAETAVPELATFDARWLPDLATAQKHLPPRYQVSVLAEAGNLQVSEEGLPLLALLGHGLVIGSAIAGHELIEDLDRARKVAEMDQLRERHAAVIDAMEKVGVVLDELRQAGQELPTLPSTLIEQGLLSLADVQGLFGGKAAATAKELDGIGRWTPKPDEERWPQAVWAVHLEGDWSAYLQPWGPDVQLTTDLKNIPGLPAPAAPGP